MTRDTRPAPPVAPQRGAYSPVTWRRRAALASLTALLVAGLSGPAGTAATRPTKAMQASASAVCTANGRIAFVRDFPRTGKSDIYTIKPSGKGLNRVTETGSAWSPAWSPDGGHLLYEGKRDGDPDVEIYRIDPDGANPVRLTDNDSSDATPAWSPDGQWIAFASARDDLEHGIFMEIYKMKVDGTEVTRLTNTADRIEHSPTWSPTGKKLAYAVDDKVKVMNADGTGKKTISGKRLSNAPDWRPTGGRIAYREEHIDAVGEEEIWTMRPDGSARRRLTRRAGPDMSPAWSPNGQRLTYSKDWNLAVMRSDGSGSKTIFQGQGDVYAPDWGPRCTTTVG